jgi:DNA-binding transcriptional ArsR family regulator
VPNSTELEITSLRMLGSVWVLNGVRREGRVTAEVGSGDVAERGHPAPPPHEIGDAISYALAHRIRVGILVALNEQERGPTEISRLLWITLSQAQHHLNALCDAGSIEEAEEGRRAGNLVAHVYRAARHSHYSADEVAALEPARQQVTIGLALQNAVAEHLAAFRAGEMKGDDPNLILSRNWIEMDDEGRAELSAELDASWARIQEIEARSAERRTRSGEEATSMVVSSIAHPRAGGY